MVLQWFYEGPCFVYIVQEDVRDTGKTLGILLSNAESKHNFC